MVLGKAELLTVPIIDLLQQKLRVNISLMQKTEINFHAVYYPLHF